MLRVQDVMLGQHLDNAEDQAVNEVRVLLRKSCYVFKRFTIFCLFEPLQALGLLSRPATASMAELTPPTTISVALPLPEGLSSLLSPLMPTAPSPYNVLCVPPVESGTMQRRRSLAPLAPKPLMLPTAEFMLPLASPLLPVAEASASMHAFPPTPHAPAHQVHSLSTLPAELVQSLQELQLGLAVELSRIIREVATHSPSELKQHRSLAGFLTEVDVSLAESFVDACVQHVRGQWLLLAVSPPLLNALCRSS